MNESASFDCDRFLSLGGSELVGYVEPFVNIRIDAIPESAYGVLQAALDGLDEVHTVYALEICMLLKPSEFAHQAAAFLSHTDAAVCCAACNSMNRLPPSLMPADLVQKIAATPTVDLFTTDLHSGERIRIGTNEEFIRDLVAKFGGVVLMEDD